SWTTRPPTRRCGSSTTCVKARTSDPRVGRGSAPGGRPRECWRATPMTWPTRGPAPGPHPWSAGSWPENAAGSLPPPPRSTARPATAMPDTLTPVLTENGGEERWWTLQAYQARGGYGSLDKAFAMDSADLLQAVRTANLRGRGGAGFPTGMKWNFIPAKDPDD